MKNLISVSDINNNLKNSKSNSEYYDNNNSDGHGDNNYKNYANHKENIDKNNTHMRLWTAVVTSEFFHKILNCVKATRKVRADKQIYK